MRNIYPIGHLRGAACLLGTFILLAIGAAPALAQCEDVGGAGDQYCEGIPGAGREQGVQKPRINPGVPGATGRSLDRAGAGAVRLVESPRRNRARARQAAAPSPAAPDVGEPGDKSVLPYLLAGLTLALLLAALVARRSGRSDGTEGAAS